MPKRVPLPGTDCLPEDILPVETSQTESNALSLRAFFYDYCIISTNPNLSRGFLSGLEMMAYRRGPKCDLVKACQAVSFATHGKPLNRPQLVHKAGVFYQELLGSLAKAIQDPASTSAAETKLIAMLLGIFQITMSDETNPGNHDAHAKGLAAFMQIGTSPLNLLGTVRSNQGPHGTANVQVDKIPSATNAGFSIKQVSGVFSIPAMRGQGESLDDLLLSLDSLWKRSESLFASKDLNALRKESIALDQRFAEWETSRATEFKPTTICNVKQNHSESEIGVGYWPGKIHTYFDLYVAGVWNVIRTARLLLLALIFQLSETLGENDSYVEHMHVVNRLVDDMAASIPYHLTDNLQVFISQRSRNKEVIDPGKYLGGLLLMHPLYVTSEMRFVPERMRTYMRKCLAWTGSNMGFGQATLLANTPGIDREFLASGCMIIWSGFLE
ncbi:putative C6 transcription factor [Mytilinidion resinicola]|uniref:C6 transcription factor n=1 Tax=Mytilinidion resinicola TaxID=574789 RepID=A0A6A6YLW8_9PEZI|nr:putative C6 transcription factor [Mytilinidion resinicola]KAF2809790.1 putative C6 transcription factor [Mytilinidion resinicola]